VDVTTGAITHRYAGHVGTVNAVAFSPNGQQALSGSSDGSLILWIWRVQPASSL